MSKRKSLSGRNVARSHTSVIELAQRVAHMLDRSGLITNVSLDRINPKGGSSQKRLIVLREEHGLHVRVLEPSAAQELYVSAPDREQVIACIEAWCQGERLECIVRR